MINDDYKKRKKNRNLKALRFIFFIVLIFIISGISVVFWDKYLFPRVTTSKLFGKIGFVEKGSEDTIVINKTEQVTVSEEQTVAKFASRPASSVVEIVSRKKSPKYLPAAGKIAEKIGSGLVVTADGVVATFVDTIIPNDAEYKILTPEGDSYDGRLLLADSFSGMALLRIDNISNLPVVEFIAPQDIKIGSKIIAIGRNGFDAGATYGMGILSEADKSFSIGGPLASSEKMQGVLKADSNFGENVNFLGGPVVDYNGNAIGILGARKEDQQSNYFIIPANIVRTVVDNFIEKGEIQRGSLGVYYILLSKENASLGGGNFDHGALVYSPSLQQGLAVLAGSAAEKAGLRIMDVILSVNGEEVNSNQNLAQLISKYKPGDNVDLTVMRDSKEMIIRVTLQ